MTNTNYRQRAETVYFWGKFAVWGGALAAGMWIQFIGDGVRNKAQDFLGISEIMDRLNYIEETVPPPPVVEWLFNASGQLGRCVPGDCDYRLVAGRTRFGEKCGAPVSIQVHLRLPTGRQMRIGYLDTFEPVELGRIPEDLIVPLDIPLFLPDGEYFWRSEALYPSCPGPLEPIPRFSPWFELTVGEE